MSKLRLIRGIAGSGKSSFAKKQFQSIILENDMFFMQNDKYCYSDKNYPNIKKSLFETYKHLLSLKIDIVVANCFLSVYSMMDFILEAKSQGYEIEIYTMTNNYGSLHSVPESVINSMSKKLEKNISSHPLISSKSIKCFLVSGNDLSQEA